MGIVCAILLAAPAVLGIGLLVGFAFRLVGFALAALIVVAGVTWIVRRLGWSTDIERERPSRLGIELRQREQTAGDPPCPLSFSACSAS